MLSDEVIEKVVERLVNRIEQGNTYVLKKIGESVKEIGTLTPSKAHELVQIMRYGGDYDKIVKKLAEITELNKKDIYKIFKEIAKSDYEFAEQFYKYRNKKYIPWDENHALKRQVDALAEITANKYINLSRSNMLGFGIKNKKGKVVFKHIKRVYNELLDEAVLNAGQGKETFDSAMYNLLKQVAQSGLKVVYEYDALDKLGNKIKRTKLMRLDSVVRMQMQGAIRDMRNEMQQQFGDEFGADGVEISVHMNPAPDHMYAQGKQFSLEQFDNFQNDKDSVSYDGVEFPATSEETGHDRRSISQYNCYHCILSVVLGINKPRYSSEELKEIIDNNNKGFNFEKKHYTMYEGQQLQRKIEVEIRKAKDEQIIAKASGNEQDLFDSEYRIMQLNKKYKKLSQVSGLTPKIDRLRVEGYKKVAIKP